MGKIRVSCILFAAMLMLAVMTMVAGCAGAQEDTDVETVESEKNEETEYFLNGIDISQHQGNIDATKLDAAIVVVRLGYSGYGSGACRVDSYFMANMEKYDGTVALYWASHAITEDEVKKENEFIMDTLNDVSAEIAEKIDYLFIDREQSGTNEGRADNLSRSQFNLVLSAQVKGLQKMFPDMKIGVYTNVDYLCNMVDIEKLGDVPYWMAWYVDEEPATFEAVINRVAKNSANAADYLEENIVMWQYSEEGTVPGITENVVDLNLVSSKILK